MTKMQNEKLGQRNVVAAFTRMKTIIQKKKFVKKFSFCLLSQTQQLYKYLGKMNVTIKKVTYFALKRDIHFPSYFTYDTMNHKCGLINNWLFEMEKKLH